MVEIKDLSIKWGKDEAALSLSATLKYEKELLPVSQTGLANPPLPAFQELRAALEAYLRLFPRFRDELSN